MKKSNRSRGGQKGHKGNRLSLPKNIEELEAKGILEQCVIDHSKGSEEYISRFVMDIKTKIIITEHRYSKEMKIPKYLYNEVSYGSNLLATIILFLKEGIVSVNRLSNIIKWLTSGVINLSTGTIISFQNKFSEMLDKSGVLDLIKLLIFFNLFSPPTDLSIF